MSSEDGMRADWRDSRVVKYFLDVCIEHVNTMGKNGSSLKRESWDKIVKEFEEKMSLKLSQKQLKNQWNYMKKQYVIWSQLVSKSGHGYDPVTHTVRWNEEWKDYIHKVPETKQFRHSGLQFEEEMRSIFDGIVATGANAWGPAREEQSSESAIPAQEATNFMEEQLEFQSENMNSASHSKQKDGPLRPETRRKKSRGDDIDLQIMAVLKTLEKSEGPSLEECNDKLNAMTMLKESDIEYVAACSIFCEGNSYREQWLELCKKPEEVRIAWIRMAGKKLGLL